MLGYFGEIRMFSGSFAPRNWEFCYGALLPIAQNTALFSILGTAYGGDGRTTFALPNLKGSLPIGAGQGPGINIDYRLGMMVGHPHYAISSATMPNHTHSYAGGLDINVRHPAYGHSGLSAEPDGTIPAILNGVKAYSSQKTSGKYMYQDYVDVKSNTISDYTDEAGGAEPFDITPPYLTMSYIICISGDYPSRN